MFALVKPILLQYSIGRMAKLTKIWTGALSQCQYLTAFCLDISYTGSDMVRLLRNYANTRISRMTRELESRWVANPYPYTVHSVQLS